MNSLVAQIEKLTPFFERVSRNKFLRAIRDGFIAAMPVILFSSIFMLIAYVPNIFGFYWSETIERIIVKPYDYTMGILGLLVAGTTAKSLTDSYNRELEGSTKINNISTILAAICGFLLLASDRVEGAFTANYLGTTGLLGAFVSAFITVIIYNFLVKRNVTIKMPEEVPPNISQTFKDVIPFSAVILVIYLIDILVRYIFSVNFAQLVIELAQPIFTYADGYLGIALIYGAMSLFWFIGIHGPSIVEPAISAIAYANLAQNLAMVQAGNQATNIVTPGLQMFVATLGGTGATFVVPFMFMWLSKSKQNKAVGRASVVPTAFGVNEPILFGAPIVLNPIFFIPFVASPIINVWLFKFFVEALGMNSFMYFLPWTTPGPIGLVLGTGLDLLSFVLGGILLILNVIIYYPFFKVYDKQMVEKEAATVQEEKIVVETEDNVEEIKVANSIANMEKKQYENYPTSTGVESHTSKMNHAEVTITTSGYKVLVLCAGGGTSGLLTNSLNKAAQEFKEDIQADAGSYGAHTDILPNYDLVILAPQVASNYQDLKKQTDPLNIQLVKTEGTEYIGLTRDPEGSLQFVKEQIANKNS